MNNPNPFIPQGSLVEQKNKARSSLKIRIFCLLAINIVGLMVLLMQGCKREQATTPETTGLPPVTETNLPPVETNLPPVVATNVPPPVVETTPAPAPVPATTEYVVQKGDTFSSIGKKMGVSAKAIADANPGVDPKKLKIGQKLVIPAVAAATATAGAAGAPVASAVEGAVQTYVVKSGDTLTKIATHFGTTIKALRAANSLTTDRIKVGQKLKIPTKAAAPAPAPAPVAPVEPAPPVPAPTPAPAAPPSPQ